VTPRVFAQHFKHFANAPGGVAKLREMVLQLAVQGKLVPQDPNDEPASELLRRIKAERDKLVKAGKFKKPKPLSPVSAKEVPHPIPDSWKWTRVREVTHDLGQGVPHERFTYVDVTSIDSRRGVISEHVQVLDANEAPSRARKRVVPGSVIYSTVRPYLLNVAVVDREYSPKPIVSTAFSVLHPYDGVVPQYLLIYLRGSVFTGYVNEAMKGMAYPAINDAKMSVGPVPLPPTPEQKRIVAKVDELMKRCDELEAQQQHRATERVQVSSACLHRLTSPDVESTPEAWRRVRSNFDELYGCVETVSALRKSILQLAVQGKLVPQDPNDEPASELLKRIKAEKDKLVKAGKIKKPKPLPPVNPEEKPFAVPSGWAWTRLAVIVESHIGKTPPTKNPAYWTDAGSGYAWASIADMPDGGRVLGTKQVRAGRGRNLAHELQVDSGQSCLRRNTRLPQ
jgi:type I restriction enzyme S subunit